MGTTVTEEKSLISSTEMLSEIDQAIRKILVGGQSYMLGSRKMTRADLSQLYKMRQDLEAQVAAEEGQSGLFDDCYVAEWPWER